MFAKRSIAPVFSVLFILVIMLAQAAPHGDDKPNHRGGDGSPDCPGFDAEGDDHRNRDQLKRDAAGRILKREMEKLAANRNLGVKPWSHQPKGYRAHRLQHVSSAPQRATKLRLRPQSLRRENASAAGGSPSLGPP